jgi:4a-hydroxytetrahydrobiopterin dehydratase
MDIPKGWAMVEERLMREFEFADFDRAKEFVDEISSYAKEINHHPELHFGWGYVIVELFTHDEAKVTEKDIDLAQRINTAMGA